MSEIEEERYIPCNMILFLLFAASCARGRMSSARQPASWLHFFIIN
jgi:hypothetical protein